MGDEINNFIKVCITVLASLTYCYFIPSKIPTGKLRLVSLLPIIIIFTFLPLQLSTINLSGDIGFLISWLATFKLLLFAFNQGPLSSPPSLSLPRFISLACFPSKIKPNSSSSSSSPLTKTVAKSPLNYIAKFLLLALLFQIYGYKHLIHPTLLLFLYCFHIYFVLEIMLISTSTIAHSMLGIDLEPPFDEPHLSTSLQDFWGKRWNLMVTSTLRPIVYHPVRRISTPWVGHIWALILAVVMTFVVSGLMHELMFFYLSRQRPTWEVMWFFVLHGFCLALEMVVKKNLNGRWRLHPVVSIPLTVGFVVVTSFWLFFPQLIRGGVDVKGIAEYGELFQYIRNVGRRTMGSVARTDL